MRNDERKHREKEHERNEKSVFGKLSRSDASEVLPCRADINVSLPRVHILSVFR
jgi:hypothetical protein